MAIRVLDRDREIDSVFVSRWPVNSSNDPSIFSGAKKGRSAR